MADKPDTNEPSLPGPELLPDAAAPRRPSSHRAPDMRDTMAELTERAQQISQEAGSKVAMAMKDVIAAAAGLAGFAIESARDLVQYMVRRGQMSQEEADRLIREAEDAHAKRSPSERARPSASKAAADRAAAAKAESIARAAAAAPHPTPAVPPVQRTTAQRPAPAHTRAAAQKTRARSGPPAKSSAAKRGTPSSSAAASAARPKKETKAARASQSTPKPDGAKAKKKR